MSIFSVSPDPETTNIALAARIDAIDLRKIKKLLRRKRGWSAERCTRVELKYKRYLYMVAMKEEFSELVEVVPTEEVDEMWHAHILDTRVYFSTCAHVFGRPIHHNPYLGVGGKSAMRALASAFKTTASVYERLFGDEFGPREAPGSACSSCAGGAT